MVSCGVSSAGAGDASSCFCTTADVLFCVTGALHWVTPKHTSIAGIVAAVSYAVMCFFFIFLFLRLLSVLPSHHV